MRAMMLHALVLTLALWSPRSANARPGRVTARLSKRMVDSQPMQPDQELKAIAALEDAADRVVCGSSFVATDIVVTAAHCVADIPVNKLHTYTLSAGRLDRRRPLADEQATRYHIVDRECHHDYDPAVYSHDICELYVMPVDEVAPYAVNASEVFALDSSNAGEELKTTTDSVLHRIFANYHDVDHGNPLNDAGLLVAGWGTVTPDGNSPSPVEMVGQFVVAQLRDCQKALGSTLPAQSIVCAVGKNGRTDSCRGDSGGPLYTVDHSTGRATLIGLVSVGHAECGESRPKFLLGKVEYPAIYTRIFNYKSWIENTAVMLRVRNNAAVAAVAAKGSLEAVASGTTSGDELQLHTASSAPSPPQQISHAVPAAAAA